MRIIICRNWLEWLKRFPRRCGYGVHSPFAFNFITGVVFERGEYYAFRELDEKHLSYFERYFSHVGVCFHFLFRLANYVKPRFFLCDKKIELKDIEYLSAGSRNAAWKRLDAISEVRRSSVLAYMLADAERLDGILNELSDNVNTDSVLLLKVRSQKQRKSCCELLQRSVCCGVTFDLYNYIVVFFDRSLIKQHYVVNFLD